MSFSISSGIEYDVFDSGGGNFNFTPSPGSATDLGPMGPFTGIDNDDDFEVGEDVTGGGNNYIGKILIEGNQYPVVTASGDFPLADGGNVFVLVPTYMPTPSVFPASFDFTPDINATSFNYCFAAGTRIATEQGETEVQDLQPGDLVRTDDGRLEPVRWVGKQTIDCHFARNLTLVRISAGALGAGLPNRDLVLTGDHAMVLDGALVNASALINGDTISFVPRAEMGDLIAVYHVETERHEALLAEGAAMESFCDVAGRSEYDNHAAYLETYGTERIVPEMDLPRISAQRQLPTALRLRLGITDESLDKAV